MEPLTWTGSLSALTPFLAGLSLLFVIAVVAQIALAIALPAPARAGYGEETGGPAVMAGRLAKYSFLGVVAVVLIWIVGGIALQGPAKGIIGHVVTRFLPVWIALLVTFALSITFKRRLGLYGKLFDSPIGMVGFALVMFWVFTALFADMIATHDPIQVISGLKNKSPGVTVPGDGGGFPYYLLGGDNLARDVFSRMVMGARAVLKIAPAATLFAFMVGITLGLPAGYFGGKLDTVLSFIANLVLAFPVILLFYLLVTPEIVASGIPTYMAAVLFLFPILFLLIMWNSRYFTRPVTRNILVAVTVLFGGWLYVGLAFDADPFGLISMPGNVLIVFVSVVFVNAPTVFRIVRGLVMDIHTRDYVAAAQTRGEGAWYIMLWEILPNARGPLIVDFCLRIGYTTILLGTLGFFGLGVSPESPDWGSTINEGRRLLSIYPHPALPPALALMSLVLGLNLLADGLREESLKD
ncbi:MAG: ABC transporter permease [Confluentimicrobium sp.]|uniref:Peptide/nickel transport system permease protein n=1 Tax=Actibacterium naphthalenivorans TaxID=1614693 RepID=A0A840CF40_9RHOB|nr:MULTISPECIES: ABC transporter permease [Actibacterium]ALG90223.1 peptide ABC transporter permease [Actibacterium sp. EMB200-NS6]MBB4022118.1 peptide/nickel transport system permease protein [Actibacterium naphthalenivorans]MBC57732.1 ABC transporter permease [Actibacterium sp.]|tara:strand:- start:1176 stop:2576 length:1401 start_codon:yes stop_codon:yes gene_type:complete